MLFLQLSTIQFRTCPSLVSLACDFPSFSGPSHALKFALCSSPTLISPLYLLTVSLTPMPPAWGSYRSGVSIPYIWFPLFLSPLPFPNVPSIPIIMMWLDSVESMPWNPDTCTDFKLISSQNHLQIHSLSCITVMKPIQIAEADYRREKSNTSLNLKRARCGPYPLFLVFLKKHNLCSIPSKFRWTRTTATKNKVTLNSSGDSCY